MDRIYNQDVFVLSTSLKIALYSTQINATGSKFRAESDSLLTAIEVAEENTSNN